MSQTTKAPSVLGGAMIIAGTAIGAGMLALPINTAGVWYSWTLVGMAITWFCMYQSGLCILEANMHYPVGTNTDTIAKDCLSMPVRFMNGLSLVFVLYILTYAYINVGSHSLADSFNQINISISPQNLSFIMVILLGGFVAFSTKAVDRVTTIILVAMLITFFMAISSLLAGVKPELLIDKAMFSTSYLPYSFFGIATIVSAFGYHGNVSSLVKYYKKDSKKVQRSIFYGMLIAAVIYILWITVTQGHISREMFRTDILSANSKELAIRHILSDISPKAFGMISTDHILVWFYNFAIISSFLGVTLGLFDWVADFFKLNDSISGRLLTAVITYIPSTVLALYFPFGFADAIGYAGLAATVWALIVPAMMMKATRKKYGLNEFQVKHGNIVYWVIIIFSVIVALSEIGKIFGKIPVYH